MRTALQRFGIEGGIDINIMADIPAGTGMGSSSSFTVGCLMPSMPIWDSVMPEQLAAEACEIEIDILKEPIGKQDQYAAAFGGLNFFEFMADETVRVSPLILSSEFRKEMQKHLIIFYTGISRSASEILKTQKAQTQSKIETMKEMVELARVFKTELESSRDLRRLGQVLHKGWLLKKQMADAVSNTFIDEAYDKALSQGAWGGKLLGAGGGGFLLSSLIRSFTIRFVMRLTRCEK